MHTRLVIIDLLPMSRDRTSKKTFAKSKLLSCLLVTSICTSSYYAFSQSNLTSSTNIPKPPTYIEPLQVNSPDRHNLDSNAALKLIPPATIPSSLLISPPTNITIGARLTYGGPHTNSLLTNAAPPAVLLKRIDDIRNELQNVNLEPHRREFLEAQLQMLKSQLGLYSSRQRLFETVRGKNPAYTNLTPNIELWENLHQAKLSKNPEQVALAKQAVANMLARRLESVQGKKYPTNVSYAEIASEYRKQFGSHRLTKRIVVISLLLLTAFVPLIILIVNQLKHRSRENRIPI